VASQIVAQQIRSTAPAQKTMDQLRQWHEDGWIDLARTDTMDTELLKARADKQQELMAESGRYAEVLGPLVLDHSRLNHAVLLSAGRGSPRRSVLGAVPRRGPGGHNAQQPARCDARRHKIRYAYTGFVTRERRLLNKADAVRAQFDWFLIVDPEAAVEIVRRRIAAASAHRP
jgi:hypothetical protein